MRRRDCLIAFAALLSGCAGVREALPPDARIDPPAGWRTTSAPGESSLSPQWWEIFGDPMLDRLVNEALLQNDDIAMAAARVRLARAQLGQARAQRLPDVQLAMQGGRSRQVNPGFGIPEEQTAGEAQVQAGFDVDLFGRLRATSEAARLNVLASQHAGDTVRLAVSTTVVLAYFSLLALDKRIDIIDATARVRQEQLRTEQARFDAGYSNALDLARAQAELESTLQLRPAVVLAISQTENSLSGLLGRSPGPIERGADFDTRVLPVIPASVPAALLRHRPDIAAAEARLAASDKTLDAVRAAFLPDIRIAAAGGFVGSTLVHVSPVKVWSLGSSVLAPLFDFGRLQSQQEAVLAEREEAAYAYRKVVLQAFQEVENQLAANAQFQQQYGHLLSQRDILAHTFALATRRYQEGYASRLDTLDAQRNLLSAQLALVQSRLDQFQSAINLMHALGGGWQAGIGSAVTR